MNAKHLNNTEETNESTAGRCVDPASDYDLQGPYSDNTYTEMLSPSLLYASVVVADEEQCQTGEDEYVNQQDLHRPTDTEDVEVMYSQLAAAAAVDAENANAAIVDSSVYYNV